MDLALIGDEGMGLAVVLTAAFAGFRHGFDIDHIAAIADITSSQPDRKRSLLLSTTYAVGHMIVLFALGTIAVLAGARLPERIDALAGRIIGATLIVLGIYVMYSLVRFRRNFRMKSRWMLVIGGVRSVLHRFRRTQHVVIEHEHEHAVDGHHSHVHDPQTLMVSPDPGRSVTTLATKHSHRHRHVVPAPSDPFTEYGVKTSLLVGMLHGVGAETPTQVLLFTSAAGVAGTLGGIAILSAFVVGLLLGNTILAVGASYGMAAGKRLPPVYLAIAGATAVVSAYVGVAYLWERPDILPSFLGG